jgi:hypothetical protein
MVPHVSDDQHEGIVTRMLQLWSSYSLAVSAMLLSDLSEESEETSNGAGGERSRGMARGALHAPAVDVTAGCGRRELA